MITLARKRLRYKETIFAYGFDRAGFATSYDPITLDAETTVQFADFYSPKSLTEADGVIIPQGVFEQIEIRNDFFGQKTFVSVDKSLLLERERQILSLLRDGKWVCFVVGSLVDHVTQECIRDLSWKRMLQCRGQWPEFQRDAAHVPNRHIRRPTCDQSAHRFGDEIGFMSVRTQINCFSRKKRAAF